MLRQLMLSKKITGLRNTLKELLKREADIKKRSEAAEIAIREAETEEEIEVVEEEVEEIKSEEEEIEKEKEELKEEIEKLEKELEELEKKEPDNDDNGGERDMGKDLEVRSAIENYVRTKKQAREMDGFKVVDGGVLVPDEFLAAEKAKETSLDLSKIVKVRKVNSGAGSYPIIKKSGGKMVSVAELEKNPELAKPTITDIAFKVETYRGYIPVSQEVIDDAAYDVVGLISEEIRDQELNTKNSAIATVLKTMPAKTVTGLDGLKTLYNTDIKKVYEAEAVISSSLYNALDLMKDENGRYLLQDDVTAESGKKLFGRIDVTILDDDVIGTEKGDLVGFFGDPKEAITLFDRKASSVKWVDNEVYGELLAGYVRFQAKKTDEEAGYYVTFTPGE